MKNEIILTEDGSHTMISEKFGVSYHSHRGSIQETKTVFIDAGLGYFYPQKDNIKVFEMGFGTGLNAIMTAVYAHTHQIHVDYTGVEAYPVSLQQALLLNYGEIIPEWEVHGPVYTALHQEQKANSPFFSGKVLLCRLEDVEISESYDVIYYDAFAPATQEELWSTEMMKKMHSLLSPGGVLVTYCAKGQFKRNLKEAGFDIEPLPGPLGKREMTRAIKR